MAIHTFDAKFGKDLLSFVPRSAGIYRFFNIEGDVIYVGKAKCLRRRIAQYRSISKAVKCKKQHKKMRNIVLEANRLEWVEASSELDACIFEMQEIQKFKPKWNVSGAFSQMYPLIGVAEGGNENQFCITTSPDFFSHFALCGAFRSRRVTGDAFFGLMRLLKYLGHRETLSKEKIPPFSYVFSFRKLPKELPSLWLDFFKGQSDLAVRDLFERLLKKNGARAKASIVQDDLDALTKFWNKEAKVLWKAMQLKGIFNHPIAQKERDLLFLFYRAKGR